MLNKKEIEYNAMSLVSTWLNETKGISNLRLVFNSSTRNMIVPCDEESAGKELANILYNNTDGYTNAKLLGVVDKKEKMFGELDIN